jgi:transcriptional regulator with XRE-family HTH domain
MKNKTVKTLGQQIRHARKAKDWSLKELKRRSGVSYQYLSRIENDDPTVNVTLYTVGRIGTALGKSLKIAAGA